ncbi:hypothetical protein QBC45DRAFT_413244 [Copromyces sp. CBS 386.78]|nr:hypothetical protein QBC45DRAFT_413244 [Copromyces sp. CBS 386.78]
MTWRMVEEAISRQKVLALLPPPARLVSHISLPLFDPGRIMDMATIQPSLAGLVVDKPSARIGGAVSVQHHDVYVLPFLLRDMLVP